MNVSNFSETVLDQRTNSRSPGVATNIVKNVVTNMGGLFSGSRNLCCISGFSPSVETNKLLNIPMVTITAKNLMFWLFVYIFACISLCIKSQGDKIICCK